MSARRWRDPRCYGGAVDVSPLGLALAGGRALRLGGVDKAALPAPVDPPRSLLAHAVARLGAVCADVAVALAGNDAPADVVPHTIDRVDDLEDVGGPAGALLGAAKRWPHRSLLVLACDLPWISERTLRELVDRAGNDHLDLCAPREGERWQPLCAFWSSRALDALARHVAHGDSGLQALFGDPTLSVAAAATAGDPRRELSNLNRPDDLSRYLESLERSTGAGSAG